MTYDCIVVGAGVAGLAAARVLAAQGLDLLVLDARDRIGGRIHTVRDPRCAVPIELGAEFVHGPAEETMDVVREAALTAVDVKGAHRRASAGRGRKVALRPVGNFWHEVDLVLRRIDPRDPDESFSDFLARKPGGRKLAGQRKLTLEFVQGFHAADASLISARALARGGSPGDDPREQCQGRVLSGYDRVPAALVSGLLHRVQLGTEVSAVRWERGRVAVSTRSGLELEARSVVVTVPLGVLQSGTLVFDPPIASLERATRLLAMGSVVRVALLFDRSFWSEREDARDLGFVHAPEQPIPVWWTAAPARVPLLIGWAGGGMTRRITDRSTDGISRLGVDVLARIFGKSRRAVAARLIAAWAHDWQADPWSRGAYSYAMVGGSEANALLARSAGGTVFFAGEAASAEGRSGTVDGAIASGQDAARRVLRSLG